MKCDICKKELTWNDDIIYAPKRKKYYWFCLECFKNTKYYKADTFQGYLNETKELINTKKLEHELVSFLKENIGFPDQRFFIKKSKINNGTFQTKQYPKKACSFKISDKELLDIYIRMKDYLIKTTKSIEITQRVHYSLAIVYNSYPKYLSYLEKQKKSIKDTGDVYESINVGVLNKKEKKVNLNDFLL